MSSNILQGVLDDTTNYERMLVASDWFEDEGNLALANALRWVAKRRCKPDENEGGYCYYSEVLFPGYAKETPRSCLPHSFTPFGGRTARTSAPKCLAWLLKRYIKLWDDLHDSSTPTEKEFTLHEYS